MGKSKRRTRINARALFVSGNSLRDIIETMGKRFSITRFLTAAIVLIACALAPSLAQAHAGHHHGAAAASTQQAIPAAAAVTLVKKSERAFAALEWRAASFDLSGLQQVMGCTGTGCCSGVPCTSCTALGTPEVFGLLLVPPRVAFDAAQPSARSGVTPGKLRRPPRTFA